MGNFIKVMADNNANIPAKMDASNYNTSQCYTSHVFSQNHGDCFRVFESGLSVSVSEGSCSVYGYTFFMDTSYSIDLPPNAEGYVCATIDLSRPAGSEGIIEFVTALRQENLLDGGIIYNIPLKKIKTNSTSVTNSVDVRFQNSTEKGALYFESKQNGKVDIKNISTNEVVGCNYETTSEHFTGRYNFNGKPIYEQIFTFNGATFKANTWEASPALPSDIDATSVTMIGSTYRTGNVVYQIPYNESADYKVDMYFSRLDRKVYVRAGNKNASGACIVRVQYCK